MMSFPEFAEHILQTCPSSRQVELYGFGSFLRDGIGSDYDILLVADDQLLVSSMKSELFKVAQNAPVDLLVMTKTEAEQSKFVKRYGCIPLVEIAKR